MLNFEPLRADVVTAVSNCNLDAYSAFRRETPPFAWLDEAFLFEIAIVDTAWRSLGRKRLENA